MPTKQIASGGGTYSNYGGGSRGGGGLSPSMRDFGPLGPVARGGYGYGFSPALGYHAGPMGVTKGILGPFGHAGYDVNKGVGHPTGMSPQGFGPLQSVGGGPGPGYNVGGNVGGAGGVSMGGGGGGGGGYGLNSSSDTMGWGSQAPSDNWNGPGGFGLLSPSWSGIGVNTTPGLGAYDVGRNSPGPASGPGGTYSGGPSQSAGAYHDTGKFGVSSGPGTIGGLAQEESYGPGSRPSPTGNFAFGNTNSFGGRTGSYSKSDPPSYGPGSAPAASPPGTIGPYDFAARSAPPSPRAWEAGAPDPWGGAVMQVQEEEYGLPGGLFSPKSISYNPPARNAAVDEIGAEYFNPTVTNVPGPGARNLINSPIGYTLGYPGRPDPVKSYTAPRSYYGTPAARPQQGRPQQARPQAARPQAARPQARPQARPAPRAYGPKAYGPGPQARQGPGIDPTTLAGFRARGLTGHHYMAALRGDPTYGPGRAPPGYEGYLGMLNDERYGNAFDYGIGRAVGLYGGWDGGGGGGYDGGGGYGGGGNYGGDYGRTGNEGSQT